MPDILRYNSGCAYMRQFGPELVKSKTDPPRQFLCSGEIAPETGIYRVFHGEHRLSHEVTVLRGNAFPVCSKCANQVHFELIRGVPLADAGSEFRVVLNSLPVFDEEDETDQQRRAG